jgi:hypothetical protein
MELSWNTQSALVYMLADLVAGSDGVLLADLRATMAAQFETPAKALKAAKQIQCSILEFARHRPNCCSAAAIVIHGETERELFEGGASAGTNAPGRSLLQYAQPSQILMTEGAYEKLREMPGLRFRPVTPAVTPGSDLVIRGQELIWRTPETPPRSSEVLPQATQIFAQNSEPLSVKVLPMPESILAHQHDMEGVREGDPEQERLAGDSRSTGEQPLDVRSPLLKRSLAVAGGLIVLSVAFGILAYHRKPAVVDHTSSVPHTSGVEQPTPTASTPLPDHTVPSTAAEGQGSSDQTDTKADAAKPKPPKKQLEKPVKESPSDFSAKDIPFLLRKAEEDAGAGSYDDARREYKIVLQLDPNNAIAKQGLRRLDLSR